MSNLHKETPKTFFGAMKELYSIVVSEDDQRTMLRKSVWDVILEHRDVIENQIIHTRDYDINFFGQKTLEKGYLLRSEQGKILERPQYLFMRVAISIHTDDLDAAFETYEMMSQGLFTHATPTLARAGTESNNQASCFLLQVKEDSIDGIYDTLKQCALISKCSGGIGLALQNVRAKGSKIRSSGNSSAGIIPMLRVFNETAKYVDQSRTRPGSIACYTEPWHADILEFLELKKNRGNDELRTRDLFFGLWIPDLFMERVAADEQWSLMCPDECPGLVDTFGSEFDILYETYESMGNYKKQVPARAIWKAIIDSQIETGMPYMLYKDACNFKSNQKNLGTIRSSNLCTEIIEYTSPGEVAVCNLASIALSKFVVTCEKNPPRTPSRVLSDSPVQGMPVTPESNPELFKRSSNNTGETWFDFEGLSDTVRVVVRNLNKIIDNNSYPLEEAKTSNKKHRPIGIGVQGLADVFAMMRMPFDSTQARQLNADIFSVIYFTALDESNLLAKIDGAYDSFEKSPLSKGQLHTNLNDEWIDCLEKKTGERIKSFHGKGITAEETERLIASIKEYGVRNSLLIAPMPTASTSQILGNNESIEPFTTNIYTRRTLSGDFQVVNQHLIKDLEKLGLWNDNVRRQLIANRGSIQNIDEIPNDIKVLYKTSWEISQKVLIDMAADRGRYIDQSQSLNLYMAEPTLEKITSMHFYGWKSGLKTGMYYLRSRPAADPIQFTVDPKQNKTSCRLNDPSCEMCSA